MKNDLHQKVFDFLSTFRDLNPTFYYYLREKNTKGRLDEGLWFPGTNEYAFVGLYNAEGGNNTTRSFGLVFTKKDEKIGCTIEIVFNTEKNPEILEFYGKSMDVIGGFKKLSETHYEKLLSQDNSFEEAQKFLKEEKPVIDNLVKEMNLNDLFPAKEKFEKNYQKIKTLIEQESDAPNYWIFQGNLQKFDFETAIKEELLEDWTVSTHKDEIKVDDKVILWIVGAKAGCYALAKVTSVPAKKEFSPDDKLWKESNTSEWKVDIEITHNLIESPIYWDKIKDLDVFKGMNVGNQGTNFVARASEYNGLLKLVPKVAPLSYNIWLIAPGHEAIRWDEFKNQGIIAIGWDELGDLSQYKDKEEIRNKLQLIEKTEGSKKNDVTACWEFSRIINPGDIVIAKLGSNVYLGWGIVKSEYIYDAERENYKNIRKVEWKKSGNWPDKNIVQKTLTNISKYPEYVKRVMALLEIKIVTEPHNQSLNQILYGPPGTGKTYNTVNKSIKIVDFDFYKANRTNREALLQRFKDLQYDPITEKGQIAFVTFHQSMNYEDFIEGIKPLKPDNSDGEVKYDVVPGLFKQFSESAKITGNNFYEKIEWLKKESSEADNKPPIEINTGSSTFTVSYRGGKTFIVNPKLSSNPDSDYRASIDNIKKIFEGASKNGIYNPTYVTGILQYLYKNGLTTEGKSDAAYVLIIDEINRGNVSQIFGELITLIEEDKRLSNDEALEVILPYSKEKFGVPPNLYIIGTMNTADRSVEALDTALRRRFCFEEIPPRYDLQQLNYKIAGYNSAIILQTINKRIEKLIDKDHAIGHSYFMLKPKEDPDKKLLNSFYKNIIPLLQEYFFGDYGKIGLVLGKGFIKKKEWKKDSDSFADFDYESSSEFDERSVYEIIDYRNETDGNAKFEVAIKRLMNEKSE